MCHTWSRRAVLAVVVIVVVVGVIVFVLGLVAVRPWVTQEEANADLPPDQRPDLKVYRATN